jgi:uncharacterized protein (TIGR02646 family)
MQGGRCAYCECDLTREGKHPHVEHFQQRCTNLGRPLTFEWSNLFRSCTHEERCGKHKDRLVDEYDPNDILKPDVDNPRMYLQFDGFGNVGSRQGLDQKGVRRAMETIRVFNLRERKLVNARLAYLAGPRYDFEQIDNAAVSDEERAALVDGLSEVYRASAYSSAILDLFGAAP